MKTKLIDLVKRLLNNIELHKSAYVGWINEEIAETWIKAHEHEVNDLHLQNVKPRFFSPFNKPKAGALGYCSVDVYIVDEGGLIGVAYYHYEDEQWMFHTETLLDYDETGAETKWKWFYPPFDVYTVVNEA